MKLKNLLKNAICVMVTSILFSTLSVAQFINELGCRNSLFQNTEKYEHSGLAHHTERDILIIPFDDVANNGFQFMAYKLGADENSSFFIDISNPGALTKDDLEGLTYLKEDYFVLLEEKQNKIYFLQYFDTGAGNPYFEILSGHDTGIPLSTDGEDGLEGISYDPNSNRLYVVSEKAEIKLFSIPIILPTENFTGDINEQQISSAALPINGGDAAGLFHLGKIFPACNNLSNNILVVNEKLRKIMEYKLELDAANNLLLNSLTLVKELQIPNEPQPEGIAVYNNKIFIASEKSSGGLSSYPINPDKEFCNKNCEEGAIEVWNAETCSCETATGCTDSKACNYNESATIDDSSCIYQYSKCDDGNAATISDRIDKNCICEGIPACNCE